MAILENENPYSHLTCWMLMRSATKNLRDGYSVIAVLSLQNLGKMKLDEIT
ncbi:MAG: hypothetical protein WBL67_03955 [Nitrososphaeraceae archaeon]